MIDRVYLCGGTAVFRQFLELLAGDRMDRFALATGVPPCRTDENVLYIILPEYDKQETCVRPLELGQMMRLRECKRQGARIYVENYPARDYLSREVFGCFLTGRLRYVNQENLVNGETILQTGNLYYFPRAQLNTTGIKVLAQVEDCIGLHRRNQPGSMHLPVLTDDGAGCVAASMNLTCYDPLFLRPRKDWRDFLCGLWRRLLELPFPEVARAFERAWPKTITLASTQDVRVAIKSAVEWHLKSGLLPAPDGSRGACEMLRSDDLEFRANLRTDVILMTAALLASAGRSCSRAEWIQVACRLADFILDRGVQDDEGFIRWYDNLPRVYSNDLGRHGLALLSLWENTGNERYRHCAGRLAQAALKWLAQAGVCSGTFDLRSGYATEPPCPSPVFHGEMAAFLLKENARENAGAVYRILDCIDLNSEVIGHSRPDVWSRALLMYCCAHQTVRDCSHELDTLLNYFERHQAPCGGIWEDDLFHHRSAPLEAGVAQGGGADQIADLLYCNNYVFAALSVLRKKTTAPRVGEMYRRLRRFLLDIQIVSQDKRFNGTWMRAFDMEYGEYYGLTLDRDWGPYCIMGGWTMGIIPLVLLNELGAPPFFG